jgi:Histidine kinase-, DNA gyrase B-, and HSP90-like ATPase
MKATPTGRVLLAVRNKQWSVVRALAELLDNSFGELRGHASAIWLQWNAKTRLLTVLDNGQGMNDIIDLFTLGKGATTGAGDIGFYGVGGSEALVWLADEVEVTTLRDGRMAKSRANWAWCIENQIFPDINNRWRDATANNCPLDLLAHEHGTLIRCAIRQDLRINPETIQERLSRMFGVALRGGRYVTWMTEDRGVPVETQLHEWNPGLLEDVISGTVTLDNGLSAHVRAGRVDGLSLANSKLSVNYIYRQVKETTAGFGRPVQGAVGDIDLSPEWLPYLTTTKDDIREDCRHLEEVLMTEVASLLEPLIEQLRQAKRAKIFSNIRISLTQRFNRGFEIIADECTGGRGNHEDEPSPPGPDPGPHAPPRPRRSTRVAEIEIENSTNQALGGLLSKVVMNKLQAKAFINEEHPLVVMALDAEPVNQRLLEQILIPALAKEIVEADALVTFGLLSQRAADALLEKYNGNALDVLLYLIRVLTDGVVEAA